MTTYKIGDLVKVDERAAFRNDVQLDNFDNPQLNLGLINSYLFSSALPGGRQPAHSFSIAPAGVLENLVQTFLSDRLDNRFYLIATYGHGKSHLALALANYFSRPSASPEVTTLLEKLSNALGDPAKASRYVDFKQSRGEFLVLRLRGDVRRSLHEQVLQGLEKALGEHAATKNEKLPFWFTEAERIIRNFDPADKEKANQFLESAGYDIPSLLQRLGNREDVYDLCVRLIQHVSGIRPNLGGEVSLAQVIHWATDKFCGNGKPLGGLLVLFDEFSLYVQKYAQRNATGELQDLLNGVSDRQGKAAFLAFSQIDLIQLADNLHIAGETRVGLKRELTRIPKKWVLFSLMESVIDAYLVQDEQRWEKFLTQPQLRGPIFQATDVAWERFKKRYSSTLLWSFEQFQERVTRGCFPLHPITTYLLCNLKLQSDDAGTPRTVLGFVLEELRTRQDEPMVNENRPNWVQPISLVDYFEGRLSGDLYSQYNTARRTIGNDAPEEQKAVLKALLLQYLAEVSARRDEQIEFLAHAAGLEERVAKQALRTLSDSNVIRYDHSYKVYTFWPASNQPKVLEETVQKKLEQFKWSIDELNALNKTLQTDLPGSNFGSFDIKVDWGHPTDWAAREYIVTADLLTEWIQSMAAQFTYAYNHRGLQEPDRSSVLWVIANRDDEVVVVREKVSSELQTTFAKLSENPPVLVAVVPQRAQPELLEAYRRRWALAIFTAKERADAGQEMYDVEIKQADVALLQTLRSVRSVDEHPAEIERPHTAYIVPTAYIGELRKSDRVSLRELLMRLYRVAYAFTPTEFFTQYRVVSRGANKLKDTTVKSAKVLMPNAIADLKALARSDSMVRDLSQKFLIQEWELLTADYRIKEQPGSRRVREAWQFIDNTIKAGNTETKLRDALFSLLNPPYGYDYNTALLVFSAWFGYHKLDLEVSVNGRRVQQQTLIDLVNKGPRDFFSAIAISDVVALRRRAAPDKATIKARIQAAGQNQFDLETANNEIVWLQEIGQDERFDLDLRKSAQQAADNLALAVALATQYSRDADQLKEQISPANSAKELISLEKKIAQLPTLSNVQVEADTPASLRQQIEQRLTAVVEAFCRDNEAPKKITDIGRNRDRLKEEKKAVAHVGLPHLIELIEQSLNRLDQREKELEAALQAEQRENGILAIINSVDPQGRLQLLRAGITTLTTLTDLSDKLARQRDTRLHQVENAITHIRGQIAQSQHDLESVSQETQLQPIRDRLVSLQPRCADTEEVAEITALLNQIEGVRNRLIAQEQHRAELKQTILRVQEQASLLELTEGVAQLQELSDLPPDLEKLRESRVRALEKAVATIHNQIEQAESAIKDGQTTQQLNEVQETLYALKTRCAETPEAEKVETLMARLEARREQLAQAERHAADIRRVLDAADPKAPLKRLIEAQQQVRDLSDVPVNLIKARDRRLAELEQAISAIRAQIDRARADLAAAQNRSAINNTRDALLKLQTRCADTPEEAEITRLISQTDQLKAELEEQERRKRAWRETINSVNSNYHRLRQLLDGQATLQALTDLPDDLSRERDARLRNIEKAIQPIQQQVDRAQQSLDAVVNPGQLQKQRDELIKLRQRCEETPLEAVVSQHIERADALQRLLEQLEKERKPQVESPTASHEQVKRLEQLGQGLVLSASQRALLEDRQEQVAKAAKSQREKSQSWLAAQEQANQQNESVTELARRLNSPPANILAFLSPVEIQQLNTLRQKVQQRIDADALITIETRFRQIQDRRLQEQCLQTLQQILDAAQD
jgi:hypothetical protein